MDPRDALEPDEIETLSRAFSEQLLTLLDECARGRRDFFRNHSIWMNLKKPGRRRRGCVSLP